MFLGVVVCLLFFNINVQSSQGLTARIKPNRTSFVFESGIKPNVTCESDCEDYNWMCTYKWVTVKNGRMQTYINKNNSRIDTPLKENVTLMCYVTYGYNIYDYSDRINISIKERLFSTATPIFYGKNDNDERTNITKESKSIETNEAFSESRITSAEGTNKSEEINYPPGGVTVSPSNDTFYTKRDGRPLHDITCEADCRPECTYTWYSEGNSYPYTTGNSLFATTPYYYSGSSRFQCRASNDINYIYSRWITVKVKDGPDIVTIQPSSAATENSPFDLTCSANCYHGCQSYSWYYDNRLIDKNTRILAFNSLSKRDSGEYRCKVTDYFGEKSGYYTVNVLYPPGSVIISPANDTFYTKLGGKPLHNITCEAECLPECTYMWYTERDFFTRGHSLFATMTYENRGSNKFRCVAIYKINSNEYYYSKWITVEVKDGPDNITIIPSSLAIENNTFTLTCSASCYHGCQSYRWYHYSRSIYQSTYVLRFHRLAKGDSGIYRCQVTDYFGEKSENYTVNVHYGPRTVTIQYSTYYSTYYSSLYKYLIEEEDYITISCKADCYPECTYLFYQNGKLLNNTYINKRVHRNMSGRYMCVAKNSILNTYKNSSNFEDINIKYKPTITSSKNQTTITAPGLFNLTISVDSFPSSNLTIFHKTKRLAFKPNVTGQLSFNVSIESCLDQGEYRVEAVNDAGSDSFTFKADVECSPIIDKYSNLPQKGFNVGDSLNYRVDFMANPEAVVSWTFIDWNKKELKELKTHQIQNLRDSTNVKINRLNLNNFGKYKLELKNNLGNITHEFYIQGPPQIPTDLNVDCPGSAIISWKPGFDGGATQSFMIEYSDNSSYWLIHSPQSVVAIYNTFMSAQINDIRPNTPYSFRIRAKNSFGSVESDTTVNCTRQNNDEMASFLNNRNALAGIGVLVILLFIAFAALVAVIKLKRRRESNNQDNSLRKQGNNSNEEDNASEIVENILYITADDAKEQVQAPADTPVDTTQNPQNGSDVYAVVEKKPKTDNSDDQPVYTDVCKSDQEKKKPAIAAKPSKVKKEERPTVNKDGLIYVDLDLKDTPTTSTGAFVIHGADDRTQYVDIDFTRRADAPPDTDNEESQNEKNKEKA